MNSSLSSFRVGSFVVLGAAALLVGVFLVGNQEGLFRSTFHVSTYFSSVEGVRSGSAVRLAGVDIGIVDRIEVSALDNRVRLDLKLNAPAKAFLKKDTYATIMPEGLVGNYYVEVTAGSRTAEEIEDGDVIQGREAVRLSSVLESTGAVLVNIRDASDELKKILAAVNNGQGTLGKLLTSEEIYNNLSHMSSQADAGVGRALGEADTLSVSVRHVVDRTDSLVANVNTMFTRLNAGGGTIGALLAERTVYDSLLLAVGNTVRATEQANVGARRFAEDMEALKHNWLLKGYFEDRGYWDEADYEHALDRKLDSLKTLESTLARQVQELEQRNAMTPR